MDQNDPVDPAPLAGRDRIDDLAGAVEDLDLDRAEQVPGSLVVGDRGAPRGVGPDERRVPFDPSAGRGHALLNRAAAEEGRVLRERVGREVSERRDVVDDPDPAPVRREHEVVVARMDPEVAHRDVGEVSSLELRPRGAAVRRNPEAEFRSEEEERGLHRVLLEDVRVAADPFVRPGDSRPGLPEVRGAARPRRHVAGHVEVERRVRGPGLEAARFHPGHPRIRRKALHVADDVGPVRSAVPGQLQVSVGGSDPDNLDVLRGFADREDVRVFLGGGVVDRDPAGLLLLLLLRVVGREIRRDPFPAVAVVARPEEELRAEIDRALLGRRGVDRRVPVEMQLLVVACFRLNVAHRASPPVESCDVAPLSLRVNRLGVGGIRNRPESVAVWNCFPSGIRDASRMRGVADPGAVVLQSAVDLVRIPIVERHMVELRDRQIHRMPPAILAVLGDPQPPVVAGDRMLDVGGVDPDVMPVAVASPAGVRKALSPVLAHDQSAARLEDVVGVGRVDDEAAEVERPPDHVLTVIARLPGLSPVARPIERRVRRLDQRVDDLRIRRRDDGLDAAPRLRR